MNLYRRALVTYRNNFPIFIILNILSALFTAINITWTSKTYVHFNIWHLLFNIVALPLPFFILIIISTRSWYDEKAQLSDLKTLWISIPGIFLFTAFLELLIFLKYWNLAAYHSGFINLTIYYIINSILYILTGITSLSNDLYFAKKANNEKYAFKHIIRLLFHHPFATIGTHIIIFLPFSLLFYLLVNIMTPMEHKAIIKIVWDVIFSAIYAYLTMEWSMRLHNRFDSN